jgi:AAA+ ATPase superfamily predicted ATPase
MIIGREKESKLIHQAIKSNKAELGIVYGRRRVGKSALLESLVKKQHDLYFEGIKDLSQDQQIAHFVKQLSKQADGLPYHAKNWPEAFDILTKHIGKGRHYVVFDEFPWMASEKTELVAVLKFYWDRFWKKNPQLTLVLCGSVAQFMVNHLIHSSALHNRKTFEIKLEPLPSADAAKFFKNLRSHQEVADFLMIFGGIPKYLEQINPKESLSSNINLLCLQKDSFFLNEFETVFKEQFKVSANYADIVNRLKSGSQTKDQLAKYLKITDGGGFKKYLDNLDHADFIKAFFPASYEAKTKSRTKRYVLWDEWIRFYLTFILPNKKVIEINTDQNLFSDLIEKKLPVYLGLAFERLCIKNINLLLKALKIPLGEVMDYGPFFRQGGRKKLASDQPGLQIDLLIVRKRKVITLIECKYTNQPIGMSIIDEIEKKVKFLKAPKNYTIERVLITNSSLTSDLDEKDYFNQVLNLDFLFS